MFYSYFDHPNSVCMSYYKHWKFSMHLAGYMMIGSIKAVIHAFIPRLCTHSSSNVSKHITQLIKDNGCKKVDVDA